MKLDLAIICKDELEKLRSLFEKYRPIFDDVHIAITHLSKRVELEKLCDEFECKHYYFDWIDDFSAARNFIASKVTGDYYFRMDCDDSIKNPEAIRSVAKKAYDEGTNIVYALYEYGRDEWGNLNATHYRETIVRRTDELTWKKSVHETIVPISPVQHKIKLTDEFTIIHHKTTEECKEATVRNFQYLIKEYNRDKEKTDPRTIAYLGRTFYNCGDHEKAIFFLQKHIDNSGWDEDRYMSWCMISDIFRIRGDYQKAISAAFEALQECPDYPDSYFRLHDAYCQQEDWTKAIYWAEEGMKKPTPKSFMLIDPSSYTWRPAISLSFCYFQMSQFDKALALLNWCKKFVPDLDFIKSNEKLYEMAVDHKNFVEHYIWLAQYIKDKDFKKLDYLIKAVPTELDENEILIKFRQAHTAPKKWSDKSIIIYCGTAWEQWNDSSVITGIGGSEEAVIYLSRELVKLGWEVTVFNSCGDYHGKFNGVDYVNYTFFNPNDEHNIVISWRNNIFNYSIKARRKIVWLHDVVFSDWFKSKREVDSFDKVVVLSQFHKTLLPKTIPDEKIYVSRNGINLPDFAMNGVMRNPHRMIYTSSYDRGIEHLLHMWPDIRKEVPDAELHLYYGWQTYESMCKKGVLDGTFKLKMLPLMVQEGVNDHGRIGHKELITEFQKSGLYVYPSHFAEISCISAMKAQACGAVPVVTDYAALSETVISGIKVEGKAGEGNTNERYKQTLINLLKDESKQNEYRSSMKNIASGFGWNGVASEWSKELFI